MKTKTIKIILSISAFASPLHIQAEYLINWSTLGGGGTVSGGSYTASGTVGQPGARNLYGGTYAIEGGFWAGAGELLHIAHVRNGSSVTFSWQGTGIVLQCSDSITGGWQDFSSGSSTDGLNFQVNVPMPIAAAKRFYRLRR